MTGVDGMDSRYDLQGWMARRRCAERSCRAASCRKQALYSARRACLGAPEKPGSYSVLPDHQAVPYSKYYLDRIRGACFGDETEGGGGWGRYGAGVLEFRGLTNPEPPTPLRDRTGSWFLS
eukprot:355472-Chlamydomonas_euryale.AAC.4